MKMRITHISDTHNKHKQLILSGGDLLIHSGDISSIGREHEVQKFVEWFGQQPYKHKVFIAGNHDLTFESEILLKNKSEWFDRKAYSNRNPANGKPQWLEVLLNELPEGVVYLENSTFEIEGVKIWGSPFSPSYGMGWAFNADRGYDINSIWKDIPTDTDIVITHSPIYGYCDRSANTNENVGCADLYHKLKEVQPHLHFAGHIHEGYGYKQTDWGYTFNGCSCNLRYEAVNAPITFDYNFENRQLNFI